VTKLSATVQSKTMRQSINCCKKYRCVSGVSRGLIQGGNLAEWGPLATVRGPLANTQKNLINDDESGYGWMAVLNPKSPENTPKNAKSNNILKTKRILIPKYKVGGGPVFIFILLGGVIRPDASR